LDTIYQKGGREESEWQRKGERLIERVEGGC